MCVYDMVEHIVLCEYIKQVVMVCVCIVQPE